MHNPVRSISIGGRGYQVGLLTIGIGVEIEAYLKSLPKEIEQIDSSGILKNVTPEVANSIVSEALQRHDIYPPDAITAICNQKHLLNSTFCRVMLKATIRQYNPGLSDEEAEDAAKRATRDEAIEVVYALSGADPSAPKEIAAAVAK
jgi:hypothetical protein